MVSAATHPSRRLRWAVLGVCVLIAGAQRLHTYDEPLERDITTYAVIGHEVLGDRWLYSEIWDNKSPLVYATFAAGESVAGYGARGIFVLGFAAAALTLLGVYGAVATVTTPAAGLWAAAAWTAVSGDRGLEANQPNIEVFLNAAMVWLFALLVARTRRPLATGALGAVASLYKLVVVPTLLLVHVTRIAVVPAGQRRAVIADTIRSLLIVAATWAAVLAYFAATGRGREFVQAVFGDNQCFSGAMASGIAAGFTPAALMPKMLWCTLPLVALALVGVIWLIGSGRRGVAATWLAYAVGTASAVALPGRFFPHYYQLWLPVYCIGAGIGLHAISRLPGEIRWWRDIVGAVVIGGLAISQLASYAQSAEEWSTAKYGRTFVDVKHFAPYVDQLLAPGETFFEWGDESGFYYYTRRSPPSRFLYLCIAVAPSTQRAQHEQDLLDDLRRSQPELLITYARYTVYPDSLALPMTQWMSERYRRLADDPRRSPFALFVRVGGAVERRLQAASSSD